MPSAKLHDLLKPFEPDPSAALELMCEAVTEGDLRESAEADYGYASDEFLRALREIKETGRIPRPFRWVPKEVCELVQWSKPATYEPVDSDRLAGPDFVLHRQRAFASSVLLQFAYEDDENRSMGENQSAATMIASALALEARIPGVISATRRTLAAVGSQPDVDDPERALMALGVILCRLSEPPARRKKHRLEDIPLLPLVEWLIAEEERIRESDCGPGDPRWLLGLTFYNGRHAMWASLAHHILVDPPKPHPAEAAEQLSLIGGMLAG